MYISMYISSISRMLCVYLYYIKISAGEAVKNKWKTIRDGYTKYKKQIKGTTGSGRRNVNYTWASQLAFLDQYNVPRASYSNVPTQDLDQPSPLSPQNQTPEQSHLSPSMQTPPPPLQITLSSPQAGPSSPQAGTSTAQAGSSSTEAPPSSRIPSRNAKRSRGQTGSEDDVGRVIEFINSKKRKELDVTDHLFLSYADTFKKFPPREQAIVKLEMAKLFSNIEIKLLDSNSIVIESPNPQPVNLSADNSTNVVEDNSELEEQLGNYYF